MKHLLIIAAFIVSGSSSFCQKTIQYEDWDGKMSQLIHSERSASELKLTIAVSEGRDTLKLIINSMNAEVQQICGWIDTNHYADDGWVYKIEELGRIHFYVLFRTPYLEDTTMRANYIRTFNEANMFD